MTGSLHFIGPATQVDLDGIPALQETHQIALGGMPSARPSRSQSEEMMQVMPLIVARCHGEVTGFHMTPIQALDAGLPVAWPRSWTCCPRGRGSSSTGAMLMTARNGKL